MRTNTYIVIGAVVLTVLLLLGVFLAGKRSANGRSTACRWFGIGCQGENETDESAALSDAPLPNPVETDPISEHQVNSLAASANEAFNVGFFSEMFAGSSVICPVMKSIALLSDNNLVALANLYKNLYGVTLRSEIFDLWFGCNDKLFGAFYSENWEEIVVKRLTELNAV